MSHRSFFVSSIPNIPKQRYKDRPDTRRGVAFHLKKRNKPVHLSCMLCVFPIFTLWGGLSFKWRGPFPVPEIYVSVFLSHRRSLQGSRQSSWECSRSQWEKWVRSGQETERRQRTAHRLSSLSSTDVTTSFLSSSLWKWSGSINPFVYRYICYYAENLFQVSLSLSEKL